MISADDINAMAPGLPVKPSKVSAEIAQYYMRQAFEEGFRMARPSGERSNVDPKKGEWFDHWLGSRTRAELVQNGLITGFEGYK